MNYDLYDIQYSLKRFIQENVISLGEVFWVYDGVEIPVDTPQPFATVDFMVDEIENITKDSTMMSTIRFQVGIRGEFVREQMKAVQDVKTLLLFNSAIMYDTFTDVDAIEIGTIQFVVNDITNFRSEILDHETLFNRTYLDVKAAITYRK